MLNLFQHPSRGKHGDADERWILNRVQDDGASMNVTIYHNPRCSKSREALAILQDAGATVTIVEYLKTPPSRGELARLYTRAGMSPRDGLRLAEPAAKALKHASDGAVLDAMAADPTLIDRPLVETDKGVRLGRPPEKVREIS
jgi:arsenate reductase (glutaredoxin)